jgi:A/G-specific adenine glycosylase
MAAACESPRWPGVLLAWYEANGRRGLPWRATRDPYLVTVSEFMLQQTQVERVLPIYLRFVARFPSVAALAHAPPADVIKAWQGLGYNSRAVRLHRLAQAVTERYGGVFPRDRDALAALPGVGPYTVAAIRAFAFGEDEAACDTNVRRVVQRAAIGFEHPAPAPDRAIDALARAALPPGRAHDFNSALMDLGATLCTSRIARCLVCPLRASCAAAPIDAAQLAAAVAQRAGKRSPGERMPFWQTARFLRGRIIDRLRALEPNQAISLLDLQRDLSGSLPSERLQEVGAAVERLANEGLLMREGDRVCLPWHA